MSTRQFTATAYASENEYYGPDGKGVFISCNHINLGLFAIAATGQIVPLPEATFPTLDTSPPSTTSVAVPAAMIHHGTVEGSAAQPNQSLKEVYKIKDMVLQQVFYVGKASFEANLKQCNPVS